MVSVMDLSAPLSVALGLVDGRACSGGRDASRSSADATATAKGTEEGLARSRTYEHLLAGEVSATTAFTPRAGTWFAQQNQT